MSMTPADGQGRGRAAPGRRLRLGISVRMLMVLVLVFGCWLGWFVRGVRVQRESVAAIKAAGGSVAYDREWGGYNPDIIDPNGKPRAPTWLTSRVGVDYVANVVHVGLVPHRAKDRNKANDATLAHVGRLRRLEYLVLNSTAISDAGLAHLKGLNHLRGLELVNTPIGDAGLAHLEGLTNLRQLNLAGTRVTDDAVLRLEKAIPGMVSLSRDDDLIDTVAYRRANDDLDFARSRPIRLASALLAHRAGAKASLDDTAEFIATVDAICDLEANDQVSLLKVAEARAQCLGLLEPTRSPRLSAARRQALQRRCADRGIAALTRAVELGYDNVPRLDGDFREVGILGNFRNHAAFPRLVGTMKAKRPGR